MTPAQRIVLEDEFFQPTLGAAMRRGGGLPAPSSPSESAGRFTRLRAARNGPPLFALLLLPHDLQRRSPVLWLPSRPSLNPLLWGPRPVGGSRPRAVHRIARPATGS